MSNRKHKNSNISNEKSGFDLYREIAPKIVEDSKIYEIMKLYNNQDDKIMVAIQNLWNDFPESRLNSEPEWITLDRSRKSHSTSKENEKPSQSNETDRGRGKNISHSERGATRGGRSSSASGRGGRGTSGRGGGSTTRVKEPIVVSSSSAVESNSWDSQAWNNTSTVSSQIDTTTSGLYSKPVGIAWKSGETFAERIKRQNAEAELAARLVQQEEAVSESLLAEDNDPLEVQEKHNDYSEDHDAVAIELEASVAELTIDNPEVSHVEEYNIDSSNIVESPFEEPREEVISSVPASLISEQSIQQSVNINQQNDGENPSDSDPAYLKMGRWADSTVAAPFQFGSFGKDISDDVQNSTWSSDIAVNDSNPDVWNGSSPSSLDISGNGQSSGIPNSLFNQTKPVQSDNKFEQKPPPGFGSSMAPTRTTSKTETLPVQSTQTAPNLSYQYPNAPPGIGGNARGNGLPPGYPNPNPYYPPPGYDIPPNQYMPPYVPSPVVPPSQTTSVPGNNSSVTGTAATASGTNNSNQTQQQLQQQQYTPPYGYFGNPYYPNQGYYYSPPQMPYYGQARGMYQPPRGYGADPYGNPGAVYGDVYGGGIYPDGYGGYPSTVNSTQGATANGGKSTKGGVGNTTVPPTQVDAASYGYRNPYNPTSDPQGGWGYQQSPPVWTPMMAYSGVNPTQSTPGVGQPPVANAQQQGQQQTQRPPANTYGGNTFNGRNGNPPSSNAGQTSW